MYRGIVFICICLFSCISEVSARHVTCSELNDRFGHTVMFQQVNTNTQSYQTATDFLGKEIKLQADIYQGVNTWNIQQKKTRPLIVLYHGGGFKSGARNTVIMQFIAHYYAQRGYVVVSADYRKGWENADETQLCGAGTQKDYLDAQYRAMQDERSLIQYFKSQSNSIGFDTNRIFLFGISSGATLVTSRLEDEWIAENDQRAKRLGPLEVFEGNRNYSTDVAGIISFAGANLVPDVKDDYQTPIIFFHGTCDNAVPFEEQYLASCSNMGYYYGPKVLSKSLSEKGICHQNIVYCSFGHDLAAEGDAQRQIPWALEDIFYRSIEFMQSVMCGQCNSLKEVANHPEIVSTAKCSPVKDYEDCHSVLEIQQDEISVNPNLFYDDYRIYIHSTLTKNASLVLNIYNMSGAVVQSFPLAIEAGAQVQSMKIYPLGKGVYIYQIIDGKKIWTSGKFWKP